VAVNVTVRDIVNFPGGTAKTVTVDIVQLVPKGPAEGDQKWVATGSTTATASGGGAIQGVFKNEMSRGFVKSAGLSSATFNISSNTRLTISVDEVIANGIEVTLPTGNNQLGTNIAQSIESALHSAAIIGGGGPKIGNLSYLNAEVIFLNNQFIIKSGTMTNVFTGTGASTVDVGPPITFGATDARPLIGLDVPLTSSILAGRQLVEEAVISNYTSGDTLSVVSTAAMNPGDVYTVISNALANTPRLAQNVMVSGVLSATQFRFITQSGLGTGLSILPAAGSVIRKLHVVDVSDPVSSVTTTDQLYRYVINTFVNQINFAS